MRVLPQAYWVLVKEAAVGTLTLSLNPKPSVNSPLSSLNYIGTYSNSMVSLLNILTRTQHKPRRWKPSEESVHARGALGDHPSHLREAYLGVDFNQTIKLPP